MRSAVITAAIIIAPLARAAPQITEFMASNSSGLTDAAGRHSDWIEIHNPSSAPQDMTGWHLTDDPANRSKWTFPAVSIPGGARLVVFASGDGVPDAGGALHTNFSLDQAGEYLALTAPDGTTVMSEFNAWPPQREDVSYGLARERFEWVAAGTAGHATAAAAGIPEAWRGAAGFSDAAWPAVINGIGYNRTDQPVISLPSPETAAYVVAAGTQGNQNYGGSLGMDFSVEQPVSVTALGAFDSGSNGFALPIRVQLWTRSDNGTPDNFADDTGQALLAEQTFSAANPGTADGGSRFIPLPSPITLPVGNYSVVAWGYGDAEMNGNAGVQSGAWTTNSGGGSLTFDGGGRFGAAGAWPGSVDGGPPNRYAAGTFKFRSSPADLRRTAYQAATGLAGNQAYGGPLGMDFKTTRALRVASLGVFDSGSNGLSTTLTAQLWRRNENGTPSVFSDDSGSALLATQTFTPADPGVLFGGNRFKALAAPLELAAGAYTVVAYGYGAAEMNGNSGGQAPAWTTDPGTGGAIQFVGVSRYGSVTGAFPPTVDQGPANRYAAGTFQYFDGSDPLIATSMEAAMFGTATGAYLRLPFQVPDVSQVGTMELEMAWDDGFSAWLNGQLLTSRRAPAVLNAASVATAAGSGIESIIVPVTALQTGTNILAVHGLNVAASDSDFLCRPRLTGTGTTARFLYFPTPTPGGAEGDGVTGFVEPVTIDPPHGFYSAPVTATLTTPTAGAEIRYTTDGSAPSAASTLYTQPLTISSTTPLRAAAFMAGRQPSASNTCTYLFAGQIVTQPAAPPGYPQSWNAIAADYGMEDSAADLASILAQPAGTAVTALRAQVESSLRALPALCITASVTDVFDSASGIYPNPSGRGDLWEKACSAELIPVPGSTEAGFQINGGLQVMGLTSRNLAVNPRLPLRVVFSRRFGPPSLHYPLFPGNPVTRFDSIALRGNTRDNFGNDSNGTYIRDQWTKELQAAMGVPASSGRFVHLFINGLYWGIYNPTERPDGDYCEEHLGGTADEWDSVTLCCPNRIKSGTSTKWQQLMTLATQGFETDAKYQFILGRNADRTRNPAYEILLDLDNFITFMVSGYYHASGDWPGNFYAVRRRGPESTGFRFITWDSDIGLGWGNVNLDKTVGDNTGWWNQSPGQIELALRAHPEYRLRVADAVQRHYFNGGACTPAVSAARWSQIAASLEPALGAELARWGDYRSPLGTLTRWRANRDSYLTSWFPARTGIVLNQLKARGLYPAVNAPVFSQHGGPALPGYSLSISGAGSIYYTTDGSDPRQWGGAVQPGLAAYSGPVTLNATTTVKARALSGGVWSALTGASFLISPPASAANLVISEIHFNPDGGDESEFLEMLNTGSSTIDLSGVHFSAGLEFTFPAGTTLPAGARCVVVRDAAAFTAAYGGGISIAGVFENLTSLDNSGERLTLLARDLSVIADFTFGDDAPWPGGTDGGGYSLTLINPGAHPDSGNPLNWRTSAVIGGTPGSADSSALQGNADADADGDGLPARLEYALGTSDTSPNNASFLQCDPATGELSFERAVRADDAPLIPEISSDLTNWTTGWQLTRRTRVSADRERLQFLPPPVSPAPARVYVRLRIP